MAVVGLGVSNLALVRFLVRHGARVEVRDRAGPEALVERLLEARSLGVAERLGGDYLKGLDAFDTVFLTPGMRKDLPELAALRASGVPIESEVGLVFRYCRAPILGVTGSAGKTTTTTLLGLMLARAFPETLVGGNIGRPLVEEAAEIPPDARVVMELSSFQLELLPASPNLAALLNLRPNHVDVHGSMDAYARAKRRVFDRQGPGDWCVFNADDETTSGWMDEAPGRVAGCSLRGRPDRPGVWLEGDVLRTDLIPALPGPWTAGGGDGGGGSDADGGGNGGGDGGGNGVANAGDSAPRGAVRDLLPVERIRLPGRHNIQNVMVAAALAILAGVPDAVVAEAAATFAGVPHRLEPVAERDGILAVNDSIATAPDRTLAALDTFERPVVLIAGGYDKGLSFDALGHAIRSRGPGIRALILVGATADAIEAAVRGAGPDGQADLPRIVRAASFREAVEAAFAAARPGDVVLLSPACASYDMFRNFEERGDTFRRMAKAWAGA